MPASAGRKAKLIRVRESENEKERERERKRTERVNETPGRGECRGGTTWKTEKERERKIDR